MTTRSPQENAQAILDLLPRPGGFSTDIALWMLSTVPRAAAPFLLDLCREYQQPELTFISNVLMSEYEDSQFKDFSSNGQVVVFAIIAAPLLASEYVIRMISSNGISIRKVVPSMLMSKYSDDEFTAWVRYENALTHVDGVRGAFLHSMVFAPQYSSGADLFWLGRSYRKVLPMLRQLQERQSVDPDLIENLHENQDHALRDGIL